MDLRPEGTGMMPNRADFTYIPHANRLQNLLNDLR